MVEGRRFMLDYLACRVMSWASRNTVIRFPISYQPDPAPPVMGRVGSLMLDPSWVMGRIGSPCFDLADPARSATLKALVPHRKNWVKMDISANGL